MISSVFIHVNVCLFFLFFLSFAWVLTDVKLYVCCHGCSWGNNYSWISLWFPFLTPFNPSFIHTWQVCMCVCMYVCMCAYAQRWCASFRLCMSEGQGGNSCNIMHHLPFGFQCISVISEWNPSLAYELRIWCLLHLFGNVSCSTNCNRITPHTLLDYVTLLSALATCITHTHSQTCTHQISSPDITFIYTLTLFHTQI